MPEMHLRQPGFTFSACGYLYLKKKKHKTYDKIKETRDLRFKPAFNMVRLIETLRICPEEQLQTKY